MNITELIAAIRVWEAANAESNAAKADTTETGIARRQQSYAMERLAMDDVFRGEYNVLARLVALANEIERLRAERDALQAKIKALRNDLTMATETCADYEGKAHDLQAKIADMRQQLIDRRADNSVLSRQCQTLQARVNAAMEIEPLTVSMSPSSEYARGHNAALEAFQEKLKGESE